MKLSFPAAMDLVGGACWKSTPDLSFAARLDVQGRWVTIIVSPHRVASFHADHAKLWEERDVLGTQHLAKILRTAVATLSEVTTT